MFATEQKYSLTQTLPEYFVILTMPRLNALMRVTGERSLSKYCDANNCRYRAEPYKYIHLFLRYPCHLQPITTNL